MREKDEEEEKKDGPVVIDAGAWTGEFQPTPEERAAAERRKFDYVRTTREIAQDPLLALKSLALHAGTIVVITVIIPVVPLYLFDKTIGAPSWEYVQDHPEHAVWVNYGTFAALTLFILLALYFFRGWLRTMLLPVWRGGFRRKPCLFATDEGFIDTRILRDVVRWEDIDDGDGEGISRNSVIHHGKARNSTLIHLRQPMRTLGGFHGGSTAFISISDDPFARDESPYDFLRAHYEVWKHRKAGQASDARP